MSKPHRSSRAWSHPVTIGEASTVAVSMSAALP